MDYISPDSNVYNAVSVVLTSDFPEESNPGNITTSGGIQLPFIPG